jgi:hypothetical protein
MISLKSFLNKESFATQIEEKVLGGSTYFDAVIEFADECNKSPEELLPFMSIVIIEKLKKSAIDNGLFVDNDGEPDIFA